MLGVSQKMEISWFTIGYIGLFVVFWIIEGIAIFNSRSGDTLSEHLWAWLGIKRTPFRYPPIGSTWSQSGPYPRQELAVYFKTPVWTMKVLRIVFLGFMLWLVVHIVTGGWV